MGLSEVLSHRTIWDDCMGMSRFLDRGNKVLISDFSPKISVTLCRRITHFQSPLNLFSSTGKLRKLQPPVR